jgi:hypothetical protein
MAYTRNYLANLTARQRASWERKAVEIKRRTEALMREAINAHTVDHPLTDMIDNVLHASEELAYALRPEKTQKP